MKISEQIKPSLYISSTIAEKDQRLLEDYGIHDEGIVVALNPGAKFCALKCWPFSYLSKLAEWLVTQWNCEFLLFVGPGENDMARSISGTSQTKVINTGLNNVDLSFLKCLVRNMSATDNE